MEGFKKMVAKPRTSQDGLELPALVSKEFWQEFVLKCGALTKRHWRQLQNEVVIQMYHGHCTRGNMFTGGCLNNFYLEMGETKKFGPPSVGGVSDSYFSGIFGIKNRYDLDYNIVIFCLLLLLPSLQV